MRSAHSVRGRAARSGFTILEMVLAAAVVTVILGSIVTTFSALQGSFLASEYQIDAQADESRVLAYISRDIRQASTVQVSADNASLTLSVPSTSTPTLNLNLGPALLSLLGVSGSAPGSTTIQYYRQGTSIIRNVGGTSTALSSSATNFQVTMMGSLARIDVAFIPRYSMQTSTTKPPPTQMTGFVSLMNANQL